jgi:hypothetical protein
MATWDELREHVQRKLMLSVDHGEWFGLTWKFKSAKPGHEDVDVLQRQRLYLVQALNEPHVMLLSDIIEIEKAQPAAMLAHNMDIVVGAIAITEGLYVMRAMFPLHSLDFEYFDRACTLVAHEAGRLRELIPSS